MFLYFSVRSLLAAIETSFFLIIIIENNVLSLSLFCRVISENASMQPAVPPKFCRNELKR